MNIYKKYNEILRQIENNPLTDLFLLIRYNFSFNYLKRKFLKYVFIQMQNLVKVIRETHIFIGYKRSLNASHIYINHDKDK